MEQSGSLLINSQTPSLPLSSTKISSRNKSPTFNDCTIVNMNGVQETQSSDFTLQLMEKAARLQSSPQLIGSSSFSRVRRQRTYLTENGYTW